MSGIIPKALNYSSEQAVPTACEATVPSAVRSIRNYFSACKALPPGQPDYLEVCTQHSAEGVERSTSAVYNGRVFLIHYEYQVKENA